MNGLGIRDCPGLRDAREEGEAPAPTLWEMRISTDRKIMNWRFYVMDELLTHLWSRNKIGSLPLSPAEIYAVYHFLAEGPVELNQAMWIGYELAHFNDQINMYEGVVDKYE
jgi:hypothetical protein